MTISYVYPNVSGIQQRGGLLQRWQLAEEIGCSYIEIPAKTIINNQTTPHSFFYKPNTGMHLS